VKKKMSHREEPREVGGIYPSQQYVVVKRKKRKELTPEQREAGQTWVYPSRPESRYLIRHEPPTTTVLKPPETYETWLPIMGPERPYVVGTHEPRVTDVTLIKTPPSVRAELREREYQQRLEAYQARRVSIGDFLNKILGVQTRLYDIEFGLRKQVLIMEQRKLGFEFVEEKGGKLYFVPKEKKGVAEALLGIHVPTLPEILGYSVPTPPELLGFGRMEPEHYNIMEPLAGFIAEFERPIYTVGRIARFETPRLPPGLLSEYSREHPAYGIGAFTGLVVQTYVGGKIIQKSPLGPPLAKAEMWVMSKVREPVIGTWLDKFLLEHSKYWATLQEYRAGTVVFGGTPMKWKPRVYHGKTTTPMSVTLKKAISDTSGSVLLPQLLTTPKTLLTPSATLLPGAFLPQIMGTATVLGLETLQPPKAISISKMLQTVKPKPIQRQRPKAFSIPVTRPKQREKLIPLSGVIESLTPITTQIEQQIQGQAQSFKQIQMQIQQQIQISPRKLRLKFEMPKPSRKERGLFGKWFPRTHPIKTHEEMWRTFTGKPVRKRKSKKKTKKKRRKR